MVVANPTSEILEIRDPDQVGFLRVSRAGVFGNVSDPFLQVGGAGRGRRGGWFEPRLHPDQGGDDHWQVPMRYAGHDVSAGGVLEQRRLTGALQTDADRRTDGIVATVAQGRPPGMLLRVPAGHQVVVLDGDGQPVLRVGGPGSTDWIDPRLQYHSDAPPPAVERAGRSAELATWRIPITVDGKADALAGEIRWVSAADLSTLGAPAHRPKVPWWWATAALAVAVAVSVAGWGCRRRWSARRD